ncbi:MAG: SAM-dependent chlorinase/fluorinase [Chloroflexi bacterium]|nr:SAM-dependent chlorinase/fluorinase [Chloroflexota bacterium]
MAKVTRPIFLLTDFGARDHLVGQVRAVIASIAPAAAIHDLTHEVTPFAIDEGAWLLETSLPVLPANAVVLAVVDPGVGTARRGLVVAAGDRFFVGPDNGLLSPAFPDSQREGNPSAPPGAPEVLELCATQFRRPHVSATFHGRDIFAPAAAHLANGLNYCHLGPDAPGPVLLPPFLGTPGEIGELHGHLIHIDHYGNAVTTIRAAQLFPSFALEAAGHVVDTHVHTFADAPHHVPFCYADSSGFLAIAVNQGHAASTLGLRRGDPVLVRAR